MEANRASMLVVSPVFALFAKCSILFVFSTVLLFLNPILSAIVIVTFAIIYFTLFVKLRKVLEKNSRTISKSMDARIQYINDSMSAFKEIKLSASRFLQF